MCAVKVGLVGIGNCACSFLQAVQPRQDGVPGTGVVHPELAGYQLPDLVVTAAFDVDIRKVGRPLAEAAFAEPNCTTRYVPVTSTVPVSPGALADGTCGPLVDLVQADPACGAVGAPEVAAELRAAGVEVLVSFLPAGSDRASAVYAAAALQAGAAFVNCTPAAAARDPLLQDQYRRAGLPLLGDDIKSQLGATTLHRALLELCRAKGARLIRTHQLNVGGNTDFLNMTDRSRSVGKRASKVGALAELAGEEVPVDAGPSGYIASLGDTKVAHLEIEGELLLGMRFRLEARLQVEDSPNAAGVVVDAVRLARHALNLGVGGPVTDVCGFLFKAPPRQYPDAEAAALMAAFAARTGRPR